MPIKVKGHRDSRVTEHRLQALCQESLLDPNARAEMTERVKVVFRVHHGVAALISDWIPFFIKKCSGQPGGDLKRIPAPTERGIPRVFCERNQSGVGGRKWRNTSVEQFRLRPR